MRYKAQFGKDYFKEIIKMLPLAKAKKKKKEELNVEDLEVLDFEVFYNVAWVMAKTADPSIPEPLEWLSSFDEFPMLVVFTEIQDLMNATLQTSKKKLPVKK